MRSTLNRALLTASLIALLLAESRSARSQPAPTSTASEPTSAASVSAAARIEASIAPTVRLLEAPLEDVLEEREARAYEQERQANTLYRERRVVEAEELYRQAWALKTSYDIAGNLGVAELKNGKYCEAMEHLVFAVKHFPVSAQQEPLQRLRGLVATARTHVVTLLVEVNLVDAEVFVEGKRVGVAPLRDALFVEPGVRLVQARRSGYVTTEASVTAEAGTSWQVSLTLEREPPPQPVTRRSEVPPPPTPVDDWRIRLVAVGGLTTMALLIIASKALPWLKRMRVRLSLRGRRRRPGRRRLLARAHRRR